MEFTDGRVKLPEILHYYGIIICFIIILFLTVLWNFWKTAKRYADIPSYYKPVLEVPYQYLTNKMKPLPFTAIIFQKLIDISKQFKKEGMVHTWCFRHILVIFGEEAVKIFATDEASAEKSADYEIIKEGFGEGLVVLNVETWKKERKLLNPVFSMGNLKAQIPIFNENAKILVKNLENSIDEPVVDLMPFLEYCVFHNICESIFDVNMKNQFNEKEVENFFELITGLQNYASSRWFFPPLVAKLHRFCTLSGWKNTKIYEEAKQYGLKIISSAIESISHKSCDSKKDLNLKRRSIVHTLLQHRLKDPSVPPSHLEHEAFTFIAGGTDTVNWTMMWCLYLLGLDKDVQKQAYDEIQSVADEFISYENLCQLQYLECIIKETLRLYPTIPIFARHLKKDLQCGKHTVPKDTTIVFFLYRLHRNPEIFPDPEKFAPDRFRSTNGNKQNWAHLPFSEGYRNCIGKRTVPKDTTIVFFLYGLHRNPEIYPDPENFNLDRFRSTNIEKRRWAHIPFSEGHRNCIGKKFAMIEMKVTLAYILRNYEITSLDRREDLDLNWNFVLLPTRRLRMHITRR